MYTLAQDLRTKEQRMTRIFEKFDRSFRNLEKELSHGRLEILPELWVHARMMMGSCTQCAPNAARALSLPPMIMGSGTRLGSGVPMRPFNRPTAFTGEHRAMSSLLQLPKAWSSAAATPLKLLFSTLFFSCFPDSRAPFSCPSLCRTLATSTEPPCFQWAGEALATRTEEPRDRVTKPKASFFRAKTRKLHIMKGLLPRAAKF